MCVFDIKMASEKSTAAEGEKEVTDQIVDPTSGKIYQRGNFIGKGRIARCYKLKDPNTTVILAGKIVSKSLLITPQLNVQIPVYQEISIHRSLWHKHIVGFHRFFEDPKNIYIILELCSKGSLMELHKRRKALTETETRYFLKHLLLGVRYLHNNKVIHRDLKLANLFINEDMELKIGNFGLATKVDYEGERKQTLCGTPNYIAPEILCKKGHSYEADIWSIGCILYTLLVGEPPFQTKSLEETYTRIKNNEYHIPLRIGRLARTLIQRLLKDNPDKRPTVEEILVDDFMTNEGSPLQIPMYAEPASGVQPDQPDDCHLQELFDQINKLILVKPDEYKEINEDEAEDPAAVPMIFISKWVDYRDKYGLGYQLSDDSIVVFFNDFTKFILLPNGENINYVDCNGVEHYHRLSEFPTNLKKKVTLLKYFRNYMDKHLSKAGALISRREGDELARVPSVKMYSRTKTATFFHLTNGTLQINYFDDHTKIILCPLMGAVTYIDAKGNSKTFRFELLEKYGCSAELGRRLRNAHIMIQKLMLMSSETTLEPPLQQNPPLLLQ